jgi:site-specific recombinase XerD
MEEIRTVVTARRSTAGRRFPADPPRVEEIVAVMKVASESAYGVRLRALIVILWRAGLRISEALALAETDLESSRGSLLVRGGTGGKRREVGMDDWGWVSCWLA